MVRERVQALRGLMAKNNIYAYVVPSTDNHQSEYVGGHFKARAFISGFNGSAGTAVITMDKAGLWTDGRYFIQAEKELAGSGIDLYKMNEENVLTIDEFLDKEMPRGSFLGFDGKVLSAKLGEKFESLLKKKDVKIIYEKDLIDEVWKDRPEISSEPAFVLDIKYAGESFESKLSHVRDKMKEKKATYHVLTSLEDIAWLFNIRGNDSECNPMVLCYSVITLDRVVLFIDEKKLDPETKSFLQGGNIEIRPYNDIIEYVGIIDESNKVLLDKENVSYVIVKNMPEKIEIVNEANPTVLLKAIKNPVELENLRKSHIKDGVAVTKFMYWLKTNIGKIEITEVSAAEKLENYRKEQENFIEPSFDTIAGYGANAAMMHYKATKENQSVLKPRDLLLVDSGGQYLDGTTDITRTIVLGEISEELKIHFTAVLRGMMNLSMAKFLYGARGQVLDILARKPIWDLGLDYKCGTGHGVGFVSSVHEAPNGFRWKINPGVLDTAVLEEGMVTTVEPGIYIEGSHGIRTENELIAKKTIKNEYGQFMEFEVITFAPIDLDGVIKENLNAEERTYLNNYHSEVYEKISPFLNDEEKEWLKVYTRSI